MAWLRDDKEAETPWLPKFSLPAKTEPTGSTGTVSVTWGVALHPLPFIMVSGSSVLGHQAIPNDVSVI